MRVTKEGWAVVETDSHLSKWIEEQGTLEVQRGYCELFREYIQPGYAVADIGACLGDHTATYARMVCDHGWVHAIEPNPEAYECLWRNMSGIHNVITHNFGLGDKACTASISPKPTELENLGANQLFEGEGPCRVFTLDDVAATWSKLNFVKIDAEGWEPKIIRGGMKILAKFRPVILLEVNRPVLKAHNSTPEDIFIPLSSLDYTFKPSEPHHSMEADMVDVLCLPR